MSEVPVEAARGQFAPRESRAWYCKRRQLLREVPRRVRARLQSLGCTRRFQSRDLLFSTSASAGLVHIIMAGRVRLVHFDEDGGETQLAVLDPGEAFREPPHGEVQPLPLFAEAIAPGEVLSLDLAVLRELVAEAPAPLAALGSALD